MRVRRRRAIVAGLVVAAAGVAGGVVVVSGGDGVDDPVDALAVGEITTVLGDGGEWEGIGAAGVETGVGPVTFVAIGADATLWASGFDTGLYTLRDGRLVETPGVGLLRHRGAMVADGDAMLLSQQLSSRAVRIADGELLPVPGTESRLVQAASGSEYVVSPTNVAPLPDGEIAFTAFPGPVWRTVDGDVEAVDGFPQLESAPGVDFVVDGFASDPDGTLYLANEGPGTVTAVTVDGEVRTVARDLEAPGGIAIGPDGTLYVAEIGAHRVVAIAPGGGEPEVIAGRGRPGFSGDGGSATAAALTAPAGLTTDGELLWIADSGNERVRVVRLR